jgi:Flp pilus assembly protein TadB
MGAESETAMSDSIIDRQRAREQAREQAKAALADIDDVVHRVRRSRIYDLNSQIMVLWGVLVFAGNVATWLWPRHGGLIWIAVDVAGIAGMCAISVSNHARTRMRSFDLRVLAVYLLFFAFGHFCTDVLGHFTPRQQGTFWPVYFMLFYTIAGLWVGYALVAIGLGITALTLIGYYFVGAAFLPWMAFVNGGGLILGGLWMRRN